MAWPFYHIVKGGSAMIFGTKNWLGLNFGVLLVWVALSYSLLPLSVWMEVRRNREKFTTNRRAIREKLTRREKEMPA